MSNDHKPACPRRNRTRAGSTSLAGIGELLSARKTADAIRACRRLLSQEPHNLAALEVLARALWAHGDYAQVYQTAASLIRHHPTEPGYRILQGMALQAMGNFGMAVQTLRQAMRESDHTAIHSRAGEMLADLQDLQSQAIGRLRQIDPGFATELSRDAEAACRARGFEMTWYAEVVPLAGDRPWANISAIGSGRA